jgi:hypothetical protein
MHVSTELKDGKEIKAKTECVFYPPPGFLDPITIQYKRQPQVHCSCQRKRIVMVVVYMSK